MQTTIAEQLIIFSFTTSIFVLALVGTIMSVSIMRLIRLQRLELAYIQQHAIVARQLSTRPLQQPAYASRDTQPKRPRIENPVATPVDIQITPVDRTLPESPYKPRPMTERKEKIS